MAYDDALVNSVQTPAPPQSQAFSLPSLLTAIGSLGLNIGGAVSGHGAVGESSLNLSQTLQRQAEADQKQKYAEDVKATQQTQKRNIGASITPRLGEVSNPNARLQIQTAIGNDDPELANKLLYNEIAAERIAGNKKDDNYSKVTGGLNDNIKEHINAISQIQKALPPEVHQALTEQQFFQSQTKPFEGPEALKEAWNQRKDAKKITGPEAAQLYNKYTSVVNESRQPVLGSDFLGKTLGFGDAPKPRDAFASYAEKNLSPEALAAAQSGTAEIQQRTQQASQAHQIKQMMANPKTRAKGYQLAEEFLASGGSAPAQQGSNQGSVEVISPSGQHGFIPAAQVKAAQSQGYKLK